MPATSSASVVATPNAKPVAWNTASYTPALETHELYAMHGVEVKLHPLLAFEDDQLMLRYDMTTGTTQLFVANTHGEADFSPYANAPATLPRLKELIIVTKASPWVTQVHNDKGITLSDILSQLYHDYVGVPVTEAEVAAMGRGEWAQLYRRVGRHSPRNSADNYFAASGMTPPTGIYGPRHLPGGSPYGAYPGLPQGYAQPGYGPAVPPGYGPARESPYGPPSLLIGVTPPAATATLHHAPGFSPTGGSPGASGAPSPATRPSSLGAMRKDWLLDRRIFNGFSRDTAYCEARLGFNAPNAFLLDLIR